MAQTRTTVRALLLTFLATIAVGVSAFHHAPRASAEGQSPIAATALQYVGTHGGQCWTFMKKVVREATGVEIGFDYRLGYLNAGAIEVSAADAQNGDIIQIADDSNTSPGASYPGLHTAIVLENLGGGRFNAVDSNQSWDEMVALRPNYNPYAGAARYGLDVHIYRMSGGSAPATAARFSAPAAAAANDERPWAVGDTITVNADPGCLNLRASGALGAAIITCLRSGVTGTVIGGPVVASGHTWVKVETAQGTGWAATGFLARSAGEAPAVAAAAAAEPEAPAAVADPPVAASDAEIAGAPVTRHTDNSPGCLRVRSTAGTSGRIVDCLPAGTLVTFIPGTDAVESNGYTWVLTQPLDGVRGWLAAEFLVP